MLARTTRWLLFVAISAALTLSYATPGKAHMIWHRKHQTARQHFIHANVTIRHATATVKLASRKINWLRTHDTRALDSYTQMVYHSKLRWWKVMYRDHLWLVGAGQRERDAAIRALNPMPATYSKWDYLVRNCEAPGIGWYANTGNSFFFGPQFTRGTWHANGGGPVAEMGDRGGLPMSHYSLAYIVRIADNTMASQGPGAWPTCHAAGYI